MFLRRLGPDPHANGAKSVGGDGCPDIWELENGDFAVVGALITEQAVRAMPPGPGVEAISHCSNYKPGQLTTSPAPAHITRYTASDHAT